MGMIAMFGIGPLDLLIALTILLGVPASLVLVGRSLRYAYRWAAVVTLLGISASTPIMLFLLATVFLSSASGTKESTIGPVLGMATVVIATVACGALLWPVAMGIHAAFGLHRLDLGNLDIDAVQCVRYQTRQPSVTWSPRKLLNAATFVSAPFLFAFWRLFVFRMVG